MFNLSFIVWIAQSDSFSFAVACWFWIMTVLNILQFLEKKILNEGPYHVIVENNLSYLEGY